MMRDWSVDCPDCGVHYTPKASEEPNECYQCGSSNIETGLMSHD